jgi:hypothetical protein
MSGALDASTAIETRPYPLTFESTVSVVKEQQPEAQGQAFALQAVATQLAPLHPVAVTFWVGQAAQAPPHSR